MKFEKFVKKHTKTIFLIIIVLLAGSMIFTFNMSGAGSDHEDRNKVEGKIIVHGKEIEISQREFHDVYSLLNLYLDLRFFVHGIDYANYAGPISYSYLEALAYGIVRFNSNNQRQISGGSPIIDFLIKSRNFTQTSLIGAGHVEGFDIDNEDSRRKLAWETIIMKHVAIQSGITVSNQEINALKNEKMDLSDFRSRDKQTITVKFYLKEKFAMVFEKGRMSEAAIDQAVRDTLLIAKYLTSITDYHFPSISQVYDKIYQESYARKRFKYALIDVSTLASEIRPITMEEIMKYYERNSKHFMSPEEIQVCYLAGFYDNNKSLADPPTDKEIETYYNEKKESEFKKEGSTPEKPQYKELNEVKDQIKEKLHRKRIQDSLLGAMYSIRAKVVEAMKKLPPEKQKDKDQVGRLAEKFAQEAYPKYKIDFNITPLIREANYEEIEKTLGKDSKLKEIIKRQDHWKLQVGEISEQMAETDKATICYILTRRIESKQVGPSHEYVKTKITQALRQEALKKRAKAKAEDIVKKINEQGPQARPHSLSFYTTEQTVNNVKTEYLNPVSYEEHSPVSLKDASIRFSEIKNLALGKAHRTETRGTDSKDYQVVIYLDDLYYPEAETEIDSKVVNERRDFILEERLKKMEQDRQGLLKENLERLKKK